MRKPNSKSFRKWPLAPLLVAAVALALLAGIGWNRFSAHFQGPAPAPETTLTLLDGRSVQLAQWRGKVLVLDFWATSCAICLVELPHLAALAQDLRPRGLEFVAIAMPHDRPDYVLDYVRRTELPILYALDPLGHAVEQLGPVPGTPTLLVLDRHGQLATRLHGRVDIDKLRSLLLELLDGH